MVGWAEKGKILDGFIADTGYQRKYAITLLNTVITTFLGQKKRVKEPKYNQAVRIALTSAWHAANGICAKRLVPFLPELISVMERHGHLSLSADVRAKLLSISISTADRLLKVERVKRGKGISTTKPGNLLKKQIKIRTFADWSEELPGFLEGDLVAHCGESPEGSFLNTLVLTDIVSGWTEFLPLLCKSSANVISGMNITMSLLPFQMLGVDTDNGSEFINYELLNFCKKNSITFTRSRAYKKNDQAHVEEKNGSIVRRLVGYDRYEGMDAWRALAVLYSVIRLYVNYFQPSLKLISKKRDASKVTKKYSAAQTPCQRLSSHINVSLEIKEKLKNEYQTLDPVDLLSRIKQQQEVFWKYAWMTPKNSFPVPQASDVSKSQDTDTTQALSRGSCNSDNEAISLDRKYRRTKKERKVVQARNWRTRKDPFEAVWDDLRLQLSVEPQRTAKSLLDELLQKQPGTFNHYMIRTLQRRVATWRKEQYDEVKKHHANQASQDNASGRYLSLVMDT